MVSRVRFWVVLGFSLVMAHSAFGERRLVVDGSAVMVEDGFESLELEDNTASSRIVGWKSVGNIQNLNRAPDGVMNPPDFLFDYVPEGSNVVWINPAATGISKIFNLPLQAYTNYTLQVDVGRRTDSAGPTEYVIQLYAGPYLLAQDRNSAAPAYMGGWDTSVLTFNSEASHPGIGDRLSIIIWNTSACCQLNVDNVRLIAAPSSN